MATKTAKKETAKGLQENTLDRLLRRITTETGNPAVNNRNKEILSRLNKAEEQARIDNQEFEQEFADFRSFTDFLFSLPEKEFNSKIKEFKSVASSIVDPFFDRKTNELRRDLTTQLKEFNQRQRFASDKELSDITASIQTMDRDAAEALSTNFKSLAKRGTLSGGALLQAAKEATELKGQALTEIRRKQALSERKRVESLGRIEAAKDVAEERGIRKIEEARTVDRELTTAELIDEEAALAALRQRGQASTLLPGETAEDINRRNEIPDVSTADLFRNRATREEEGGTPEADALTRFSSNPALRGNRLSRVQRQTPKISPTARRILSNPTLNGI